MPWSPGDVVEWREIWRGRVLGVVPLRVVADSNDLLAVYIASGTPFSFPEQWPWADRHPWEHRGRWKGHGALILWRPGDAYTVWALWDRPDRAFAGWYVNFQRPIRRTETTLDTFDHQLDIWITPDGAWSFKDEDDLAESLETGRLTAQEIEAIRATGLEVATDLERDERWWSDEWAEWRPPAGWDDPSDY